MNDLTQSQRAAIAAPGTSFLTGNAGSGKTTALSHRLLRLLQEGEPAYTLLVLVAEAEDGDRFRTFLQEHGQAPGSDLTITTYTFLARQMVELFWPLVAGPAGFERPYQPPTYLHYDLAQLLMWRIVRPMLQEGAFAALRMRPQRLISQILDTMNRAALNRLSLEQARERQIAAWAGDPGDARHLQEADLAARRFRSHCQRNSLLDVSLAVRVFDTELLQHSQFHRYFGERFRHLLVDNVEEQTPAGQNFIASLSTEVQTASIAYDEGGGYKQFLSADPQGARRLQDQCRNTYEFQEQFTGHISLVHLATAVSNRLLSARERRPTNRASEAILDVVEGRYRHEMARRAISRVAQLLASAEITADEAAIITPRLDGALRHSLQRALRQAEIPFTLLRRRSSPRDEPRVRAWLTLLALAHPHWEVPISAYDIAEALALSVAGLDPARATLLGQALFSQEAGEFLPTSVLSTGEVQRIGADKVEMVEELRQWLNVNRGLAVDRFLRQLYEEVLSRPPFQPHPDAAGSALLEWIVDLSARLQHASRQLELGDTGGAGQALLDVVNEGLVRPDPPELGEPQQEEGIIITTIHGYLLSHRSSQVQVWLDVSNPAWWDIPRQPLSNPFVLAPGRPSGQAWTMADEFRARNERLSHLVQGLAVRCHRGVVLARSTLDQRGQRQDSPLWRALRQVVRA